MPILIEAMERHGNLQLDPEIRERLLAMSAATIDQALRQIKGQSGGRHRRSGVSTALRRSIPVRDYCAAEGIVFTRCRPYRKNDQAWVEQKNGAVVRRIVGYRRLAGLETAMALAKLFAASRLFVNYFQPSFKLAAKHRHGATLSASGGGSPHAQRRPGARSGDLQHPRSHPPAAGDPDSPSSGWSKSPMAQGRGGTSLARCFPVWSAGGLAKRRRAADRPAKAAAEAWSPAA